MAPTAYVFLLLSLILDPLKHRITSSNNLISERPTTMSLPWNGPLDLSRNSNSRRTREAWVLRGFLLVTFFNLVLLYKLYHPETKTPLDDFQVL